MNNRLVIGLVLCVATSGCARNAGQVAESPTPAETASPTPTPSESPSPPALPVALEGPVNNKAVSDLTGSGAAVALSMQMTDFAFDPTFVKVTPGANVKLSLRNAGALADHTFTMDSLAVHRQLKPGETAELVIQLPASGAFRFYCRLHVEKGMQGAFYFNPGDTISPVTITPLPSGSGTGARSSTSSTRRSTGSTPPTTSPRSTTTPSGDLEIPDLEINEPDDDGNIRGSRGQIGQGGTRGNPGVPGEEGEEGAAEEPEGEPVS